jgi:hypothetical protein
VAKNAILLRKKGKGSTQKQFHMMRITMHLRKIWIGMLAGAVFWVAIVASPVAVADGNGTESATVSATAESADREASVKKAKTEAIKLLNQADKNIDNWEFEEARDCLAIVKEADIYQQSEELRKRVAVAEERLADVRKKAESETSEVRDYFSELDAYLGSLNIDAAERTVSAIEGSRAFSKLEWVKGRLEKARARLEKVRENVNSLKTAAQKMLDTALQAAERGSFQTADELLERIRASCIYSIDAKIREAVDGAMNDVADYRSTFREQQDLAEQYLADAERALQEWKLDSARSALNRVYELSTYDWMEEARNKAAAVEAELAVREDTFEDGIEQSKQLIERVKKELAAWNFNAVPPLVNELKNMRVYGLDDELQEEVANLEQEFSELQAQNKNERAEIQQLLDDAREAADEWDFAAADKALKQARAYEVYGKDTQVQEVVDRAAIEIEKIVESYRQKQTHSKELLAEAAEAIYSREFDLAETLVSDIRRTDLYKRDKSLQKKVSELEAELASARSAVAEQIEDAHKLLSQAERHLAEWRVGEATDILGQLGSSPAFTYSEDIREAVQALYLRAEDVDGRVRAERESVQKDFILARRYLSGRRFGEAESVLDGLRDLKIFEVDKDLNAELARIDEEIEAGRQAYAEQEERLRELMQDAQAAIDSEEYGQACVLLEEALGVEIVGEIPQTRARLQGMLERAESALTAQRQAEKELRTILDAVDVAIAGRDFGDAERLLNIVHESPVLEVNREIKGLAERREEQLRLARKDMAEMRSRAEQLAQEAREALGRWDVEGAKKLVGRIQQLGVYDVIPAVREMANGLEVGIQKLEKRRQTERQEVLAALVRVDNLLDRFDVAAAELQLKAIEDMKILEVDEGLKKQVQSSYEKCERVASFIEEEKGQFATLLAEVSRNIQACDFASAWANFQKIEEMRITEEFSDYAEKTTSLRSRLEMAEKRYFENKCAEIEGSIDEWKFGEATETLNALEELPLVERDADALEHVAALKNRLASEGDRAAKLEDQFVQRLDGIKAAIEAGNVAEAERLLEKCRDAEAAGKNQDLHDALEGMNERLLALKAEKWMKQQWVEARNTLNVIATKVSEWEFAEAEELLAQLRANNLYEEDTEFQNTVDDAQERLNRAMQEYEASLNRVNSLLREADELMQQNDFARARNRIDGAFDEKICQVETSVCQQVEGVKKALEKRQKEVGEDYYDKIVKAFSDKNYPEVQLLIEKLNDIDVKLDARQEEKLTSVREEVTDAISECQELFKRGNELYEDGEYEAAKEIFVSLQQRPFRLPAEMQSGLDKRLATIDVKIREKKLSEAQKYYEAIKSLEARHAELLEAVRARRQAREHALNAVEKANREWQNKNYEDAKEALKVAKKRLEELEIADDPELKAALDDVEYKLANIDQKIEEMKARQELRYRFASMMADVEELKEEDLLRAEESLNAALAFAEENSIELTDRQRTLVSEVRRRVDEAFGEKRRARAERYWELLQQADLAAQAGECHVALRLLDMVLDKKGLSYSDKQKSILQEKLTEVSECVKRQNAVLSRVKKMEDEAQELFSKGHGEDALQIYGKAFELVQNELPLGQSVELLQNYVATAEKVVPTLVNERIGELERSYREKLNKLAINKNMMLGRFFLERGSYASARRFLEELPEENMETEERSWVENQLKGLDEKIASEKEDFMIKTHDEARRLYEAQKRIVSAAEEGKPEEVESLQQRLEDMRLAFFLQRVQLLRERSDYPAVCDLASEEQDLVRRYGADPQVQEIVSLCEKWQKAGDLFQQALKSLKNKDVENARENVASLQGIALNPNPWKEVDQNLEEIVRMLDRYLAQKKALQQTQPEVVRRLRQTLDNAQMQKRANDKLVECLARYADGRWQDVLAGIKELMPFRGVLLPPQLAWAVQAQNKAEKELRQRRLAQIRREVDPLLDKVQAAIGDERYAEAEDMLQQIKDMKGYADLPEIAQSVKRFEGEIRIALDRNKAEDLLTRIRTNIDAGELDQAYNALAVLEKVAGSLPGEEYINKARPLRSELQAREAENMLKEVRQRIASEQYGAARDLLDKIQKTDVYAKNATLRREVDDTLKAIKIAEMSQRKVSEEQIEAARRVLDAVRQKTNAWDFETAKELLNRVQQNPVALRDVIHSQVSDVRAQLNAEMEKAEQARLNVQEVLEIVDNSLEKGEIETASQKLAQVKGSKVYEYNDDVQAEYKRLTEKLELEKRKAKVVQLIDTAEESYEQGRLQEAEQYLERASAERDIFARSKDIRERWDELTALVEEAKKKYDTEARQIELAEKYLDTAEDELANHNLKAVRLALEEARRVPVLSEQEYLRRRFESLEAQVEDAVAARKEALSALDNIAARVEEKQLDQAREELDQMADRAVVTRDKVVHARFVEVEDSLNRALSRQRASKMVAEIEASIKNEDYREAARMIARAESSEMYNTMDNFRQNIDRLHSIVAEAEKNAERLYKEAREAYNRDDTEELKAILDELKAEYSNTRFYAENL